MMNLKFEYFFYRDYASVSFSNVCALGVTVHKNDKSGIFSAQQGEKNKYKVASSNFWKSV